MYQDIDPSKVLDSGLDDLVAFLNRIIACNCSCTALSKFLHDLIGYSSTASIPRSIERTAEIVDNNLQGHQNAASLSDDNIEYLCTSLCEETGVSSPETGSCSSNDRHLSIIADF